MQDLQNQIQGTIDHLKNEYAKLQVGRASANLIEGVLVQAYGSPMPLKGTANISTLDAKTLKVEPWDKGLVGAVEKGIREAGLGLNPQNMGEHILVPIPPMTEERRKDMVKRVSSLAEEARISIRHSREEARKNIKQAKDGGDISEDQQRDQEQEVQDKIDAANRTIEEVMKKKETEVMSI
ncbi:MAG TPA: ribosome recycling factor [Candidatus Gracilibacteria bacterium]